MLLQRICFGLECRRLRSEHRIVGNFIGCLPSLPRQDQMLGLPMELMTEEVFHLATRGIVNIVEYKQLYHPAEEHLKQKTENMLKASFSEQQVIFKEERIKQLMLMADKIIEGKRRKTNGIIDEELVLQEEIRKIPEMSEDLMMVQIFTRPFWTCRGEAAEYSISLTLRCRVFSDLWEKGYYITAGEKFGGDFLVYPGDPFKFHSHYIAVCVDENQLLTPYFLIQKGRLGTNVKKTVLLCTVNEDGEIMYQSLNWNGK
ncbi:tRNA-splicing endonuclease subunit Sen34-like isoform X2 [Daphnia carinata]|uniref:tRNA-splicing endonuclease subunit Sen34-like isoform X2 n=1 Tax=Daphnia carinata TaxID=120202 RepID=UPI00257CDF49|nr:tRNA-splicing endonuclease subunit Sen34-like isoform X2 [Daphnia carinata]